MGGRANAMGLKRKEFGLLKEQQASWTRDGRMRKLMKRGKVRVPGTWSWTLESMGRSSDFILSDKNPLKDFEQGHFMIWLLCGLFFFFLMILIKVFVALYLLFLSLQMRVFIVISPVLLQNYILDVLRGADQLTLRSVEKKHVSKKNKYTGHLEIQDMKLDASLVWYLRLPHLEMDWLYSWCG